MHGALDVVYTGSSAAAVELHPSSPGEMPIVCVSAWTSCKFSVHILIVPENRSMDKRGGTSKSYHVINIYCVVRTACVLGRRGRSYTHLLLNFAVFYRRKSRRFVRAAGAVKALRARTFGGEGAGTRGAIGFSASRFAKSLVDTINGWDADRDGENEARVKGRRKGQERAMHMCAAIYIRPINIFNLRSCTAYGDGQVMI